MLDVGRLTVRSGATARLDGLARWCVLFIAIASNGMVKPTRQFNRIARENREGRRVAAGT